MSSLPKPINIGVGARVGVTVSAMFFISTVSIVTCAQQDSEPSCYGKLEWSVICDDGEIESFGLNGTNLRTTTTSLLSSPPNREITLRLPPFSPSFSPQESYLGESYLTIQNDRHHVDMIPGGKTGSRNVYAFDYNIDTGWQIINVHCLPLSLIYQELHDRIVGHCAVNRTYTPYITCVPYFVLGIKNGRWTDMSGPGRCSHPLHTTRLTEPIIIKYSSNYEGETIMLYFAEQRTNRLHAISLSQPEANVYTDNENDALMIKDIIQAINHTFTGLLVTFYLDESSSFYYRLFSSIQHDFVGELIRIGTGTDSAIFNSYWLDYFVTFTGNHHKVIIYRNGTSTQYPLIATLDYPIHCQNIVEAKYHYLVCLAGGGHSPLLISITVEGATNQMIPYNNAEVVIGSGKLAQDIFYLFTAQRQVLVYLLDSTVTQLETYSFCGNDSFVPTNGFSNLKCNNSRSLGNDKFDNDNDGYDADDDADVDSYDSGRDNFVVPVTATIIVILIAVATSIAILIVIVRYNRRNRGELQLQVDVGHDEQSGRPVIIELESPMIAIRNLTEAQECTDDPNKVDNMSSEVRQSPDGGN